MNLNVNVSVCTHCRVWSSLPKRALPSGLQWMCRNIQVSLLFKRLPLYPLFVCFSKTSIFSVDNKRTVAVGREAEAEGRTRERNRGFKEGKWEEKRREKLPLNSDHCLDVKQSWSRFCWHRSQQIKSPWTEWGERERYWETERKTKITNFNIDTYRQTCITQKTTKTNTKTKRQIWLEWEQQMYYFQINKGRGYICWFKNHTANDKLSFSFRRVCNANKDKSQYHCQMYHNDWFVQ